MTEESIIKRGDGGIIYPVLLGLLIMGLLV